MDLRLVIGLVALIMAIGSVGVIAFYFFAPKKQDNLRNLMNYTRGVGSASEGHDRLRTDESGEEFDRIKKATQKQVKGKEKVTLNERLFQAGFYTPQEVQEFHRFRLICPIVATPLAAFLANYAAPDLTFLGLIFGLLIGLQLPFSVLDRRHSAHNEEVLFYLPLVIEQISIGVSSSLDVGPCLARIVEMADERDTHNVVTELVRQVQAYVRSGAGLEDSLTEVGKRAGHTELKHSFMALAQVAKHGGEITRQLQELADSVQGQRETKIEGKIKKLELEATGPVALVFVGFLVILLIGFGVQIRGAFE